MAAPYPEEVRIGAVASLIAGESIYEVSERTGIPRTTLISWRNESKAAVAHFHTRTRERMAHALYDTVTVILTGVRATARRLDDDDWASKQDAAGLASLVGALTDRGVRLLSGAIILDRPDGPDRPELPAPGGQPEGDGDYVP